MQNLILPRTADHSTEHLDIAGSDPSATSNNLISFLAIWWTFIKAGGVPWQAPSLQVRETDFRRTAVLNTFLRYLKARSRHLHNMRKLHQRWETTSITGSQEIWAQESDCYLGRDNWSGAPPTPAKFKGGGDEATQIGPWKIPKTWSSWYSSSCFSSEVDGKIAFTHLKKQGRAHLDSDF